MIQTHYYCKDTTNVVHKIKRNFFKPRFKSFSNHTGLSQKLEKSRLASYYLNLAMMKHYPNLPNFNRKLAAAVMPEDVVLRQQSVKRRRRSFFFGWLKRAADTTKKPSAPDDETQSSSASAFRPYDWHTEHLPLIRKLEEEKKRLPAVEESSSMEEAEQHRREAAVITPEEASTDISKEQMELSHSSQMSDGGTLSSESADDQRQPVGEDKPATSSKKNDGGCLPHVSSTCSLASLLEEEPSQRIFSPIAA
jgi:hypothetical protein